MANYQSANVIFVDTSAAFPNAKRICGVRYVGAAASSASIKADANSSGAVLWTDTATTSAWYPELEIRDNNGVYVTITGTASVYIYLEMD